MKLHEIYEAGAVMRYHTKRTDNRQTVADHTWGACVILLWLYVPVSPPADLMARMLVHDVPELITGDTPAPAKWRSVELKTALAALETQIADEWGLSNLVDDGENPVIGYCDNAELSMHCIARVRMGNLNYRRTAEIGMDRMKFWADRMPDDRIKQSALDLILRLREDLRNVHR